MHTDGLSPKEAFGKGFQERRQMIFHRHLNSLIRSNRPLDCTVHPAMREI